MKKLLFFALITMSYYASAQNYGYVQPTPVPYQAPCQQVVMHHQQPQVFVQQGYTYSNEYDNQYSSYQNYNYVQPSGYYGGYSGNNTAGFSINIGNFSMGMQVPFGNGYPNPPQPYSHYRSSYINNYGRTGNSIIVLY